MREDQPSCLMIVFLALNDGSSEPIGAIYYMYKTKYKEMLFRTNGKIIAAFP